MKVQLALITLLILGIEANALNKSPQLIKSPGRLLIKRNLNSRIITIIDKRKSNYINQNPLVYSTTLDMNMDSIFTVKTPFENALFMKTISFEQVSFLNNIDFSNSVLHADADFRYVNFNKTVDFSNTHFQTASFYYSNFNNGNFDSAVFSGTADFGRANFYIDGVFSNAAFNATAAFQAMDNDASMNFCGSVFRNTADFTNSTFGNITIFESASFLGKVYFQNTVFAKKLYLNDLNLSNETQFNFDGATLPDSIDFSYNSKIANEVDFTMANLGNDNSLKSKPTLINLYRTDISKLKLDYIHFKLYFSGTEVAISYYGVQFKSSISNDEKNMIYEALLNNFKIRGQIESYKLLDIEYQQFKLENSNHQFYKLLFKYWWNFGYNKEYIFRWTFGFLLFFTLINIFILNKLNKNVYLIENFPNNISRFQRIKSANSIWVNIKVFFNRFWYSLVYTTAIFFKVTIKIENFKFQHKLGTAYLFIIYIVGLVCLAYMANFIIQK